jgi:hypothetical protein
MLQSCACGVLLKPKDEREDNITMVSKETGCGRVIFFYPLICSVSPSSDIIPLSFLAKILYQFLNSYTDSETVTKL